MNSKYKGVVLVTLIAIFTTGCTSMGSQSHTSYMVGAAKDICGIGGVEITSTIDSSGMLDSSSNFSIKCNKDSDTKYK